MSKFKDFIKEDMEVYNRHDKHSCLRAFLLNEQEYPIWKYIKFLRREEYYDRKNLKLLRMFYCRKKNKLGEKLNIVINKNCTGKALKIWHYGNIVINYNAVIGDNCTFHGNNCIGNNGLNDKCPVIGNNVSIGYGATIIGDIRIADNVKIAAGAVVNKTFDEPNITIAGVPARKIKDNN
ncbi:serine O-acetyltransferase [Intestinibacter sp.]